MEPVAQTSTASCIYAPCCERVSGSQSNFSRYSAAQFLRDEGLYETRDELERREDVLGRLSELAQRWVTELSDAHGYGADGAVARIYTFGSFRLGVHSPGVFVVVHP